MERMSLDEVLEFSRGVARRMALATDDTVGMRAAKVTFGLSAIAMLASVVSVSLMTPGLQVEAT